MKVNVNKLIKKIQNNLTPDLLKKEYRKINKTNKLYGHCFVATETLYYLLKDKSFFPYYSKDYKNITHWWLQNDEGKILDVTKEQYLRVNKKPPYNKGKRHHFLQKPGVISNRTKILMKRLKVV